MQNREIQETGVSAMLEIWQTIQLHGILNVKMSILIALGGAKSSLTRIVLMP